MLSERVVMQRADICLSGMVRKHEGFFFFLDQVHTLGCYQVRVILVVASRESFPYEGTVGRIVKSQP